MGVRGWDGPGRQASWGLLNPPCPVDTAGSARKKASRSSAGRVKGSSSLLPVSTWSQSLLLRYLPVSSLELMRVSDISTGLVHNWCSISDGPIAIEITHSSTLLMVNISVCNKINHNRNSDGDSHQWMIIHWWSIHHLIIHSTDSHWTPVTGWVPGLAPRLLQQTWCIMRSTLPSGVCTVTSAIHLVYVTAFIKDYIILNRKQL